uniref:BHLH domain-containing protein n=1 Tax=Ciona intestinalis TaxID=7719 RepID=F6PZI7_CIOIN
MSFQRNVRQKEKKRTECINKAFSDLRKCIPNVPSDTKLSKIKTLHLASSYIAYLSDILKHSDTGDCTGGKGFRADLKALKSRERRKSFRKGLSDTHNGTGTTHLIKRASNGGTGTCGTASDDPEKPRKGRTGWPEKVWAQALDISEHQTADSLEQKQKMAPMTQTVHSNSHYQQDVSHHYGALVSQSSFYTKVDLVLKDDDRPLIQVPFNTYTQPTQPIVHNSNDASATAYFENAFNAMGNSVSPSVNQLTYTEVGSDYSPSYFRSEDALPTIMQAPLFHNFRGGTLPSISTLCCGDKLTNPTVGTHFAPFIDVNTSIVTGEKILVDTETSETVQAQSSPQLTELQPVSVVKIPELELVYSKTLDPREIPGHQQVKSI